jgi:hypothetical protein
VGMEHFLVTMLLPVQRVKQGGFLVSRPQFALCVLLVPTPKKELSTAYGARMGPSLVKGHPAVCYVQEGHILGMAHNTVWGAMKAHSPGKGLQCALDAGLETTHQPTPQSALCVLLESFQVGMPGGARGVSQGSIRGQGLPSVLGAGLVTTRHPTPQSALCVLLESFQVGMPSGAKGVSGGSILGLGLENAINALLVITLRWQMLLDVLNVKLGPGQL